MSGELKEIVDQLEADIEIIQQYERVMDEASWGYEEGVLLTGDQAKKIIEALKETDGKVNS